MQVINGHIIEPYANPRDVNLSWANLKEAKINYANLFNTNLNGSTLISYNSNYFYQENLKNLYYNSSITVTTVGREFN